MPNPGSAYPNTRCDECDMVMEEGDDVFFHDGMKLCEGCAEEEGLVCDCGGYKKPEFKTCYECNTN